MIQFVTSHSNIDVVGSNLFTSLQKSILRNLRDNSDVELNDGRIVRIESIYVVRKCRCESENCKSKIFDISESCILFFTRELQSSQVS